MPKNKNSTHKREQVVHQLGKIFQRHNPASVWLQRDDNDSESHYQTRLTFGAPKIQLSMPTEFNVTVNENS